MINIKDSLVMLVCLWSFLFFAACSKISKPNTKKPEQMEINLEDCHDDRKSVSKLTRTEGKLTFLAESWVIVPIKDETQRYIACNMPDKEFKEGQKVVFDADVKEVFAHERRFATPCLLASFEYVD